MFLGRFRHHNKKTAPDNTNLTFETLPVQRGQSVKITYASVMDYTRANKKLILGIRDVGGSDHYFDGVDGVGVHAGVTRGQLNLEEGERLIGIVEAPGTGDVCYFTVHGERYKVRGA